MFMPLISQIPFSPDELKSECSGMEIVNYIEKDLPALDSVLEKADAISLGESLVSRELVEKCPALKWIQLQSVGYDKVDLEVVRERKILLTTARGMCGIPVSEHVIMQMLVMCRHFPFYCSNQKAGAWVRRYKEAFFQIRELWGKTIGIIGTGDIGSCTATRAKAFGMTTIGCNRSGREAEGFDTVVPLGMLDMLLMKSDYVVLALPLTDDTHHLIGERELGIMKPSAMIINIARGSVIDEKALIAALKDRRIAAAALDVFEEEPLPSESPLWKMENVVITPHCAGWGENVRSRFMAILHANCRKFLEKDYSGMTGRVC